ncbi:hypothetical protein HOLleu_19505 [Holothuria leucospilota]|uniref:Uncharacterized protein n=1 Tax=Holothuria leucospilota TaxID=206669 RepID=A0A9Q1BZY4_HOLLE|nr:hypothetical protein HOLleu_19505 [Holothuria leucospilota]
MQLWDERGFIPQLHAAFKSSKLLIYGLNFNNINDTVTFKIMFRDVTYVPLELSGLEMLSSASAQQTPLLAHVPVRELVKIQMAVIKVAP